MDQGRVIALIGTRNVFAHHLLRRLIHHPQIKRIVAVDVAPLSDRAPELLDSPKLQTHQLDLTLPSADAQLTTWLGDEGVEVVLHLAFLEQPVHDTIWAHELESIGTMHILNACAAIQAPKLVVRSSTVVYGASPGHPNFLNESAPLSSGDEIRFVADKVDAETQIQKFSEWNRDTRVTVLRFCPIIGPHSRDFIIPYLAEIVKLRVLGRDPLIQMLYEDDAVAAMELAIFEEHPGIFNIAPDGVLPLKAVLQATHSRSIALPLPLARGVLRVIWALDFRSFPPDFLEFLRYLCVADNRRAREKMGFHPKYSTREALHLYRQTEAFASASSLFG